MKSILTASLLAAGFWLVTSFSTAYAQASLPAQSCSQQLLSRYGDQALRTVRPADFLEVFGEAQPVGKDETIPAFCTRVSRHQAALEAKDALIATTNRERDTANKDRDDANAAKKTIVDAQKVRERYTWVWWAVKVAGIIAIGWLFVCPIRAYIIWPFLCGAWSFLTGARVSSRRKRIDTAFKARTRYSPSRLR